jgi:hypothetical protein
MFHTGYNEYQRRVRIVFNSLTDPRKLNSLESLQDQDIRNTDRGEVCVTPSEILMALAS